MKKAMLSVALLFSGLIFFGSQAIAGSETDWASNEIFQELKESGRLVDGQFADVFGVPCVKVKLWQKETIRSFVEKHPSIAKHSDLGWGRIAFLNRRHSKIVVWGGNRKKGIAGAKVFVPLDFSVEPRVLPEIDCESKEKRKFIKVHLNLQYVGCYEYGKLKYCFPISSGILRKDGKSVTPSADFVITGKEKKHYSRLFNNTPMPYSMQLLDGHYFLHAGPVPGHPASHGCMRFFYEDIEFLFNHWAEIGTPGRTVGSRPGSFKYQSSRKG